MTRDKSWKQSEPWVYVCNAVAVLWPGLTAPTFATNAASATEPGSDWNPDDLKLLVEEGRRQLDRQLSDLEHIRGRAQAVFTTTLAAFAVAVGAFDRVVSDRGLSAFIMWSLSALLLTFSLLGAAAIATVRADFGRLDAALVSAQDAPILRTVASAYGRAVIRGEDTVATRITLLRDAVLLLLLGFTIQAFLWVTLH